jgi:hypothetical protein
MGTVSEPFISRDDLAAYLYREAGSLDSDELAIIAIDGACDAIRDFTGQEINRVEDDTVTFSSDGYRRELLLPERPAEVDEVRLRETVDDELEVFLDWVLLEGGILRLSSEADFTAWPEGNGNIEVDYAHGWAAADLPRSIRLVALTFAARVYQQGIARQEATGSSSITYSVASSLDLSAGEKALIARYRAIGTSTVAGVPAAS